MESVEAGGYGADRNGLGQASAFVGIASLLLAVIPYGMNLSFLLAPAAIVMGLIARRREPKKMANVGLATGLVALLLTIALIAWAVVSLGTELEQSFSDLDAQPIEGSN
jgi:apolipoprotein N-acyltransferase